MPASWPAAIKVFSTKLNIVDSVEAAHVNELQDEVKALETYLGIQPQGAHATVAARLANIESRITALGG